MRFKPKSKARTVRATRSGMAHFVLQPREVEAGQFPRRAEAFHARRIEDDGVARYHGEPGVQRWFVPELARPPAGAAERDEDLLRSRAAPVALEHVLAGGV